MKTIYLFLIFMLCLIFISGCSPQKKTIMKLNGKKEISINISDIYKEEGTNVENYQIEGTVNTSKEGTYTLNYTYEDQTLTRTVHVVDPNRITTNLNGSKDTYVKEGDPYVESGCHSIDKKDGNLSDRVKISGNVDTEVPGDYKVTYRVTNSAGYTSETIRNVHVIAKEKFQPVKNGVPVLMYHYVYTDKDQPEHWNNNYIKDTELKKQLKYLRSEHFYYPSWTELRAYIDGKISLPKKSVILTFDDGQKGFLKYGIPLFEKYKVPVTSFVIAKNDGKKKIQKYASPYVSFQSHSYGMHVGGSSIGHGGIIFNMTKEQIVKDLKKCQKIVQNTEAFAYPYGDVSENGISAVEETGFLCAFNTHNGKVRPSDNPYDLTRVRICGDYSFAQFKILVNQTR